MIEIRQGGKRENLQSEQIPEKKPENKGQEEKEKTASLPAEKFPADRKPVRTAESIF